MNWQLSHRNQLVYAILGLLCLAVVAWQWVEHQNVRQSNRDTMVRRGRDITSTLGLVLRSQRSFGQFTAKERLEPALKELIRPGDLNSIVILSATGDPVVSAGEPMDTSREFVEGPGITWENNTLILMNLVDLGSEEDSPNAPPRTTIVLSEDMEPNPFRDRRDRDDRNEQPRAEPDREGPQSIEGRTQDREGDSLRVDAPDEDEEARRDRRRGRFRAASFGRPPWISETEYQELIQRRGVHSFVIGLSTDAMTAANSRDLWMRVVISLLTLAAAGLSALAWRNVARSAELQIRLVKAGEMNAHLKELNLAAAGLAHETRNPLNLIRGLAQMISKDANRDSDINDRSKVIMEEADRVTAQLNEFINYSRPREVRRVSVSFDKMAREIARALTPDAEDKNVTIRVIESDLMIEADDPLLRQVLFNLILNAVQAVTDGGFVEVEASIAPGSKYAAIEIRDNGPGVPEAQRSEIFKPYVTMHQNGTGLGLSVVQQIVSTHGWDIKCLANDPQGAVFRIEHVKLAASRNRRD